MSTLLTRDQLAAHQALRDAMDNPFADGTFRLDHATLHALINGQDALIATAREALDLTERITALCDERDRLDADLASAGYHAVEVLPVTAVRAALAPTAGHR